MTRFLMMAVAMTLAVFGGACTDDSPVSPSSTAPTFAAQLRPGNEVPPLTNADASGRGNVSVTLFVTRDAAQTITAATADFQVNLAGFPANTTLTGAHIHNGRAGQNAGVVVSTGIASGEIVLADGSVSFSRTGVTVSPIHAQNMLNDPAGFYFNVHSTLTPPGAARGQLVRIQ